MRAILSRGYLAFVPNACAIQLSIAFFQWKEEKSVFIFICQQFHSIFMDDFQKIQGASHLFLFDLGLDIFSFSKCLLPLQMPRISYLVINECFICSVFYSNHSSARLYSNLFYIYQNRPRSSVEFRYLTKSFTIYNLLAYSNLWIFKIFLYIYQISIWKLKYSKSPFNSRLRNAGNFIWMIAIYSQLWGTIWLPS